MGSEATATAFSEGNLASVSSDGVVRISNTLTSELLCELEWPGHSINAIAFGAGGQIASASEEAIRIWDPLTRQELRTITTPVLTNVSCTSDRNKHMVFSKSGDYICVIHDRITASRYAWRDGSLVDRLSFPPPTQEHLYHVMAISPSGDWLALSDRHAVQQYSWEVPLKPSKTIPHADEVSLLAFSPDETLLATARARDIAIWDLETCSVAHKFNTDFNTMLSKTMIVSQLEVIFGMRGGTIVRWFLNSDIEPWTMVAHSDAVSSLVFSKAQNVFVSGSYDGSVKSWDSLMMSPKEEMVGGHKLTRYFPLVFMLHGTILITRNFNEAFVWDTKKGILIQSLGIYNGQIAISDAGTLSCTAPA